MVTKVIGTKHTLAETMNRLARYTRRLWVGKCHQDLHLSTCQRAKPSVMVCVRMFARYGALAIWEEFARATARDSARSFRTLEDVD